MPLLGTDEAKKRFKKAKKYSSPDKKEFDLDRAIRLMEEAVSLKPESDYSQKLQELRQLKAKCGLNLSLQVAKSYPGVIVGKVEQGTIRNGDEVMTKVGSITQKWKVIQVRSPKGFGIPGEEVSISLEGNEMVGEGSTLEGAVEMVEPSPEAKVATSVVRNVTVDGFTRVENLGGDYRYPRDVNYTRIRVEHKGDIPCVVELPLSYSRRKWLGWGIVWVVFAASFWPIAYGRTFEQSYLITAIIFTGLATYFMWRSRRPRPPKSLNGIKLCDKDIYKEWKRITYDNPLQRIPQKVIIHGRKIHTCLPKGSDSSPREWARRVFDVPNATALGGSSRSRPFLRIEPDNLVWVRRKGKPEEIEKAREVLVSMAEKIEKQG